MAEANARTSRKSESTSAAEAAQLRDQIAALQADVALLLQSMAEMGKSRGEAMAHSLASAVQAGAETLAAGKDAAAARAETELAEMRAYVKAYPLRAVGIAALAGTVVGLLFGRR